MTCSPLFLECYRLTTSPSARKIMLYHTCRGFTVDGSLIDIANELVELCRQGRFLQALELFAEDAVSVEPIDAPDMPAETRGREAIHEKGMAWGLAHEIHEVEIKGPFVGGFQFAVYYCFDVTHRESGKRLQLREMGLYDVADDKIVREEFFYNAS